MLKQKDIFNNLETEDAIEILKEVASKNKRVAAKIEKLVLKKLKDVDVDKVARRLYDDLCGIDIEDLYDIPEHPGYDYEDPSEEAWVMFEDELEFYIEEIKKYQKLRMHEQAKKYCMGVLKALFKFYKDATTEFSEWVPDAPRESFNSLFHDWQKKARKKDVEEMKKFVKENCKEWFDGISRKSLRD